MAYELKDINFKTVADPKGFVEEGRRSISPRWKKPPI